MYIFFTKQIMHIVCALGIWVFVLVLMLMEQNNPITLKIDQTTVVHPKKAPCKVGYILFSHGSKLAEPVDVSG